MKTIILGIESSCDDTSAAVVIDGIVYSNVIASQEVHQQYGGVVPELASRAHQQNIVPVVDRAFKLAGIDHKEVSAIAFTRGPGLLGSLLVGVSFAKGFAIAQDIPLIDINHLQAHVLSHFIIEKAQIDSGTAPQTPTFPFLCLLVSGGHTQIIIVKNYFEFEIIGQTIDDAAGEAFDKCAKVMGLPYPGGPHVDKLAQQGDATKITIARPNIAGLNFSFSGLKTSFLYLLRDQLKLDPDFIENNKANLAASLQTAIVDVLMTKLKAAIKQTGIRQIAIAGGVAANSGLRNAATVLGKDMDCTVFIPSIKYTTDNAAMVTIAGYYKFLSGSFAGLDCVPFARFTSE